MPLSRARTRLLLRLRDRKGRPREAKVLVEGPRALSTALEAGATLDFVVAAEEDDGTGLLDELEARGVEVLRLPRREVSALSDTEAPQGILGVALEPPGAPAEAPLPVRTLVLDRIQDPGNAGALVRSAVAMGVGRVVALDGTVDPWNPKAVRAAAGEGFRIPIVRAGWDAFDGMRRRSGVPLLVADGGGADVRSFAAPRRWALLVGNEGAGPRTEAFEAADAVIALPLAAGVESLNAAMAGSLLLWALGPAAEGPTPSSPERDPRLD